MEFKTVFRLVVERLGIFWNPDNVDLDWLLMDVLYSKSSLENNNTQPQDRYYINFKNEFMKLKNLRLK